MSTQSPTAAFVREAGTRPWVYGHRGMRGAPENTLPAFERALAHGADGVELDVRQCKSGEVVVFHDPDLRRMALRDDRIADLDLATLQRIDLGDGAKTPLLRAVLDLVLGQGKRVNVEIKGDVPDLPALCRATADVLRALGEDTRVRVVVSSFDPRAPTLVQAELPSLAVAFLYEHTADIKYRPALPHYGEHPKHTLLDAASITEMRKRASFVNTWTVNDPAQAKRIAALGVDAIITDVVDVVLAAVVGR
jgi:glycerophosphoryl diester phosphodiesterase